MASRSPKGGTPGRVVRRKARPRTLATPPDRFLPLEARGQQAAFKKRKLAARGPVDWSLDGSGRVWFALCHDAPNSAGKVLELEFGL